MARHGELLAAGVALALGAAAQPLLQLGQREVELVQQRGGQRLRDRAQRHEHAAPRHRLRVVTQRPRELPQRARHARRAPG